MSEIKRVRDTLDELRDLMYMMEDYHDGDGDYFESKDVLNSLRDVCERLGIDDDIPQFRYDNLSDFLNYGGYENLYDLVRDELMELEESIERFS